MVKQLNIVFENEEFKRIEKLKKNSDLKWRKFILFLVEYAEESIKKGDLEVIERRSKK